MEINIKPEAKILLQSQIQIRRNKIKKLEEKFKKLEEENQRIKKILSILCGYKETKICGFERGLEIPKRKYLFKEDLYKNL